MAGARRLTGADVRNMTFAAPPVGKRGYNKGQVDVLLGRIADRLDQRNTLSPRDVESAAFDKPPVFRRGYNEDEVDAFLDLVVATLRAQ